MGRPVCCGLCWVPDTDQDSSPNLDSPPSSGFGLFAALGCRALFDALFWAGCGSSVHRLLLEAVLLVIHGSCGDGGGGVAVVL